MELEAVLDALGWQCLPVWARIVAVAYSLGIVAHGNIGVVRNLVNTTLATLRGSVRVGNGLVAWWRRPSAAALARAEDARERAEMRRVLRDMHNLWVGPAEAARQVAADHEADARAKPRNPARHP